ncbi:hypothetical protein E2562_024980 [Oryza meyeriana var. granulata]|uniref:Uncharacterized protein n=1 Tax=Oryza meyeriana var. granulata TaxID=110450 RepID=A0A6G1DQG1_9ORYZ|nr:hypothetical protein E2562_024980 [Oryza meyeriana var. granulata]
MERWEARREGRGQGAQARLDERRGKRKKMVVTNISNSKAQLHGTVAKAVKIVNEGTSRIDVPLDATERQPRAQGGGAVPAGGGGWMAQPAQRGDQK